MSTEAFELEAELTRRHAILRAVWRTPAGDALVATREGVVTYLTGYTTATWSNHSRPIIAVLTPSTLDVVCAETEADAVRSRVPGVTVHPYVELRSPDGLRGLPDGAIQFTPHACEVLATLLRERDAATIGVDALGAVHPPASRIVDLLPASIGRFDASGIVWAARLRKSAWEIERMRAASDILERAFADLHAALRPGMSEREIHNASPRRVSPTVRTVSGTRWPSPESSVVCSAIRPSGAGRKAKCSSSTAASWSMGTGRTTVACTPSALPRRLSAMTTLVPSELLTPR